MSFPAVDAFGTGLAGDLTAAGAAALHNQVLAAARQLPGAVAASEVTISGGTITPTGAAHTVDTEGGASTDDLIKIAVSGVPDGHWLLLTAENTSRVVTVKTQAVGVGKILLDGAVDFVLDQDYKKIMLRRVGNNWLEIMRVAYPPAGAPHGRQVFTESGSFTVPAETLWITAIGGGGGGGGGAGNNDDSPNTADDGDPGANGGNTTFGSGMGILASGGFGGDGGKATGAGGTGQVGYSLPGQHSRLGTPYGGYPLSSPVAPDGTCEGLGGSGGAGTAPLNTAHGGGGGASGCFGGAIYRKVLTRTIHGIAIGQVISVVIGDGGAGGAGGAGIPTSGENGADGHPGCLIVEW